MPADAPSAWQAVRGFTHLATPVDESHFSITVRACPRCGQRFVSVFAERVDWVDSEDPQCWSVLPVTAAEADDLIAGGADQAARSVESMGRGRRFLWADHPKDGPMTVSWRTRPPVIGPHD